MAPKGKLMAAKVGFYGSSYFMAKSNLAHCLPFSFTWQDSHGGTLGRLKRTLLIYITITPLSISFISCSFVIIHEQIYKYIT